MDRQLVLEMEIVSNLSSAINEASKVARQMVEEEHPNKDIFIRVHQVIPTLPNGRNCVIIFNYELS